MKGCVFIIRRECGEGFLLAGFEQIFADADSVCEVFREIADSRPPGLVFIGEGLLGGGNGDRIRFLERQWGGVVVSLPEPSGAEEAPADDPGSRFVARVLGYQMKL
ncbi:MAG: hypothetical protein Kow0089_02210 [Desulfobulbaceae bacterium]